jgi:hypothetical protein
LPRVPRRGPRPSGAGKSARPFRSGEVPQTNAIGAVALRIAAPAARRPVASGGGPCERLPAGVAGSLASWPIRGKWLQAVLAQGREVEREVHRACKPPGEACASVDHRGRD